MAPFSLAPASGFDILDEEGLKAPLAPRYQHEDIPRRNEGVLVELSVDHSRNQDQSLHRSQPRPRQPRPQAIPDTLSPKAVTRGSRRRPILEPNTFEPLASVDEEMSLPGMSGLDWATQNTLSPILANEENIHPLALAKASPNITIPIEKQLAGQFEWLVSYPAPACTAAGHHGNSCRESQKCGARKDVVYGCNLLCRKSGSASPTQSEPSMADTFTFIATPIDEQLPELRQTISSAPDRQGDIMALSQSLPALYTPNKTADMVEVVEQMLSPPLTTEGDRTTSFIGGFSPRGTAMSSPRIEDSLAEIDKLEDELEAVDLYAQARDGAGDTAGRREPDVAVRTPASTKRVTIAAQPATMRIKASDKIRPSLRRSSSLTFRDRQLNPLDDIPEQKVPLSLSRSKSTTLRPTTFPKATVKSTKAPTIPSFELPGEVVSRRLKEQREARQAQQAEAKKAQTASVKSRSQKPLTRPNFELPGEAISRRKREQHEAKLRAQEEEDRKRREFKARPIRYSIGPSTLPRETITSRARQNKDSVSEHKEKLFQFNASHTLDRTTSTLYRGRNSISLPQDNESRATSASTGSLGGQRRALSLEDAAQQRMRGREIFARDNSFTENKQRAKREQETAAQRARVAAAERSRALSREWAEKKRQKELSLRKAMREIVQPEPAG